MRSTLPWGTVYSRKSMLTIFDCAKNHEQLYLIYALKSILRPLIATIWNFWTKHAGRNIKGHLTDPTTCSGVFFKKTLEYKILIIKFQGEQAKYESPFHKNILTNPMKIRSFILKNRQNYPCCCSWQLRKRNKTTLTIYIDNY